MARNWSDNEIDAIVGDYFDMLGHEQAGRALNKAEHRRALMGTIGRSEGSIERKHMNISAVMAALGLPYIDGYKPYRNYQKALFEAVEARLGKAPDLHALLTGETVEVRRESPETLARPGLVFDEAPPPREMPAQAVPEYIRRIVHRFEPPAERDARNRYLGKAGEALVFEVERRRLNELGRKDLSDRVRWVARDDGDGYGFDILSFDGTGDEANRERWLEIKTTNGPRTTPFFITKNELCVSKKRPDVFRIVRLYDFQRQVRAYRLEPPLEEQVWLSPTIYRASL